MDGMCDWISRETVFQDGFNSGKISYEPCVTVAVNVLRGRNISVGTLHDFADIPDPKVKLRCIDASCRKSFETKVAANQRNPVWGEKFTFVFPPDVGDAKIDVGVFESDFWWFDPKLGAKNISLQSLEFDQAKNITIKLENGGEIDLKVLKQYKTSPDYRLSLGLSVEEREFRVERKPKTMEAIRKFLDKSKCPNNLEETPTVALAISGGGYRAVANSCGVIEALTETGLFDSLMYISGLSGSSWYISSVYLHKALVDQDSILKHHDWLRERMKTSLTNYLFDISFYKRYREYRNFKIMNHQGSTFVDLYGLCIGETFLGEDHTDATLSSLIDYVDTADVPYPIISCAHVHDYLPMSQYWDEVEMTPHEVSIPGYAINVKSDRFNSRWGRGVLQQELPTPTLPYAMGASGSAFAILWAKLTDMNEVPDALQAYIERSHAKDKERGENEYLLVESDESDDQMLQSNTTSTSTRRGKVQNFADTEDKWIDQIEADSSEGTVATIGRSFILERTAKALNVARHCNLLPKYTFDGEQVEAKQRTATRFKRHLSSENKNILLCDSAIGCNLPAVHVMRPQRTVDVLIVMDCSNYLEEDRLSVELFATVQNQIHDHGIKFPKISIEKILLDPFRELYLFEDPDNPECPVVLWFTLANTKFRQLDNFPEKESYAESLGDKFNDFSIFPESSDFGTLRLSLTERNFDRLRELAKFNVLSYVDLIKEKIGQKVQQLKDLKCNPK